MSKLRWMSAAAVLLGSDALANAPPVAAEKKPDKKAMAKPPPEGHVALPSPERQKTLRAIYLALAQNLKDAPEGTAIIVKVHAAAHAYARNPLANVLDSRLKETNQALQPLAMGELTADEFKALSRLMFDETFIALAPYDPKRGVASEHPEIW